MTEKKVNKTKTLSFGLFFIKVSSIISIILLNSFIFSSHILAAGEFVVDSDVLYTLFNNGQTKVTHNIRLENVFPTLYATNYSLFLEKITPSDIKVIQGSKQLNSESTTQGDNTTIEIKFEDPLVGKGAAREFSVFYFVDDFASRTGEVWEISIPKLKDSQSFRNYNVKLIVPQNFGNEAYVSPEPFERIEEKENKTYSFNKESLIKSGVTAGFGEFQVFSFTLNYHLENPLAQEAETQIPIPPDTAFQKIYLERINPSPHKLIKDQDGNWLAAYRLDPRQRMDIQASGFVQIFASARQFDQPEKETLDDNLKETQYWQSDSEVIQEIAKANNTPRKIYDYVTSTLKYDYERVKPNVQRLGALGALSQKESAICMEFTDLFIAIARAAGIPAREINGYAYTENPDIQPLSLVADVLHSWPEYWDDDQKIWIPIDPTWGSTTGGVDYFDKLDLRHFTFVVHGKDPIKPFAPGSYKLGPNPQKDVFVNFSKLPEDRRNKIEIKSSIQQKIPLLTSIISVQIKNLGPTALYNTQGAIYFDTKIYNTKNVDVILPFSSYEYFVDVENGIIGKNLPKMITISFAGKEIKIASIKEKVIINNLLSIFLLLIILFSFVILRMKKTLIFVHIRNLLKKLNNIPYAFTKKTQNNKNP